MRRLLIVAGLLVAFGCGDNLKASPDAGPTGDGSTALTGCLDHPDNLLTPPTNRLPCELIPPGLVLDD